MGGKEEVRKGSKVGRTALPPMQHTLHTALPVMHHTTHTNAQTHLAAERGQLLLLGCLLGCQTDQRLHTLIRHQQRPTTTTNTSTTRRENPVHQMLLLLAAGDGGKGSAVSKQRMVAAVLGCC